MQSSRFFPSLCASTPFALCFVFRDSFRNIIFHEWNNKTSVHVPCACCPILFFFAPSRASSSILFARRQIITMVEKCSVSIRDKSNTWVHTCARMYESIMCVEHFRRHPNLWYVAILSSSHCFDVSGAYGIYLLVRSMRVTKFFRCRFFISLRGSVFVARAVAPHPAAARRTASERRKKCVSLARCRFSPRFKSSQIDLDRLFSFIFRRVWAHTWARPVVSSRQFIEHFARHFIYFSTGCCRRSMWRSAGKCYRWNSHLLIYMMINIIYCCDMRARGAMMKYLSGIHHLVRSFAPRLSHSRAPFSGWGERADNVSRILFK